MSPNAKALMLPRLMLGVGALIASGVVLVPMDEVLRAYLQIAGGLLAIAGAIWLLIAQRRASKSRDEISRRP